MNFTFERFRCDGVFNKPWPVQGDSLVTAKYLLLIIHTSNTMIRLVPLSHIVKPYSKTSSPPSPEILLDKNQTRYQCWKKLLVASCNRRLHWMTSILKVQICRYHFKNREDKIWGGQLGAFLWSSKWRGNYGSSKERRLWNEAWSKVITFWMVRFRLPAP